MVMSRKKLKIGLHGMDAKGQDLLRMFLVGQMTVPYELVDQFPQDVAIFDADVVDSPQKWEFLRRQFDGLVLVFSVLEKNWPETVWVQKPVSANFKPAMQKVMAMLEEKSPSSEPRPFKIPFSVSRDAVEPDVVAVTSPRPIKAAEPVPDSGYVQAKELPEVANVALSPVHEAMLAFKRAGQTELRRLEYSGNIHDVSYEHGDAEVFYRPEEYFQGFLNTGYELSRRDNKPALTICCERDFSFCTTAVQFSTSLREQFLRSMSVIPLAGRKYKLKVITPEEFMRMESAIFTDPKLINLEVTLWKVALWTARGRVPEGTSLTDPVQLRCWPNFTRLPLIQHALNISALWVKKPTSLLNTAKILSVPYADVFALYSACLELGLIRLQPQLPQTVASDLEQEQPKKRGFLSRLLGRLTDNS